jgi:glucose-6-phosphate isomerase
MLPYTQNFVHSTVPQPSLDDALAMLAPAFSALKDDPSPQSAAIFRCAREDELLADIQLRANAWRERYRHLVVIGAGGSGLSGKALGMLKFGQRQITGAHTLHVLDNLSPFSFEHLLATIPVEQCCFLVISKSGSTVEPFAQLMVLLELLRGQGIHHLSERMAVMTMLSNDNPLRQLADRMMLPVIAHDPALGGRFSIFSAAGLLPAAFVGLDIRAFQRGAATSLEYNIVAASCASSPAALGAAHQTLVQSQGRNVAVFMPYSERLWGLALWWRQSWAESLGKGGKGSTPMPCVGTGDQHSQLQLWLDGPDDKSFTLLLPQWSGLGPRVDQAPPPLDYLNGHTLGDLVAAQQRATMETLVRQHRPVRVFDLPHIDEFTLGALLMHFTLEIILAAALMQVNPFDQPAVEESKRLAHTYLDVQ